MELTVTPRLVELTYEAALRSYWRKEALRKFLRGMHVAEGHLATWAHDESKREFLDRTFSKLQGFSKGRAVILTMARELATQTTFPDLRGWEDSALKIADATRATVELRQYLRQQDEAAQGQVDKAAARAKAASERQLVQRHTLDRVKLQKRLEALHGAIGTQQGGYDFQDWFYDAAEFSEVACRRPYVAHGRQIDGTLTNEGTTYLVELKFSASQAAATDVDSLKAKVDSKADNTMGILIAISGFSSIAIQQASGSLSKLLLLDGSHLYLFLQGAVTLPELIARVRRHASQTGDAYLPSAQWSEVG